MSNLEIWSVIDYGKNKWNAFHIYISCLYPAQIFSMNINQHIIRYYSALYICVFIK